MSALFAIPVSLFIAFYSSLCFDPIRLGQVFSATEAQDVVKRVSDDPLHGVHRPASVVRRDHDIFRHLEPPQAERGSARRRLRHIEIRPLQAQDLFSTSLREERISL